MDEEDDAIEQFMLAGGLTDFISYKEEERLIIIDIAKVRKSDSGINALKFKFKDETGSEQERFVAILISPPKEI